MRVFLLHSDRDFAIKPSLHDEIFDAMTSGHLFGIANVRRDREKRKASADPSPPTSDDVLAQDLELETLFGAMARGDEFLFEMAKRCVLSSLRNPEAIVYRQRVLADCLAQPDAVRELYGLAMQALENERRAGGIWRSDRPDTILRRSVQLLAQQLEVLRSLRRLADEQAGNFRSEGFGRFFAMIHEELDDGYLDAIAEHLQELQFKRGVLMSVKLGKGNKGSDHVVRKLPPQRWTDRLPFASRAPAYGFSIAPRDEAGFRALEEIRSKAINVVADAVAQSTDHIKAFFSMLRLELAFYLGCLNLRDQLDEKGEPTCFPEPVGEDEVALAAQGLYDVCLTFHVEDRVVGNELEADGKGLVMITGANQGGKSTLLRSVGLAQLMMQSGMFVGARSFRADVRSGVFTHYKREEDDAMESGKLDEELRRMSDVADQISPRAMLLCNESFASTNEREGSEIARQVIRAMLDQHTKVFFVTHMYDLAHSMSAQQLDTALFLRAERQPDGRRTFKVREGEPLPTSYGEDSYRRIFGDAPHTVARAVGDEG